MKAKKITGTLKVGTGFRFSKKDIEIINRELQRIAKARGGYFEAQDVVDEAQPWNPKKKHPLKRFFTAKVADAARKQWLSEAAYLIQAVKFVTEPLDDGHPHEVRMHIRTERGYSPILRVMSKKEEMNQVEEQARKELASWYARYQHVKALAAAVQAVVQALKTFSVHADKDS